MIKSALVTGGNRGIGFEICRTLAADYGFKVYMGVRSINKGKEALVNNSELNIIPLELDVSTEEGIKKGYRQYLKIKEPEERLYLLINNAAAALDWIPNESHYKSLEMPYEMLEEMYRTNVLASIFILRYFMPSIERGGRVVNVVSGSGEFSNENAFSDFQIGYAPTKSALIMTTKKLAAAAVDYGVVVNACCPGWCKTDMGGWNASNTASDGALSVIRACFLHTDDPPNGGYFRHGKRIVIENAPLIVETEVRDEVGIGAHDLPICCIEKEDEPQIKEPQNDEPYFLDLPYEAEDIVISCRNLERGLAFQMDGLYSCCLTTRMSPRLFSEEEIISGKIDHAAIVEKRKQVFVKLNSGDRSISCCDCGETYKKKYKDVRLDQTGGCMFNIQYYTTCNYNCSYCSTIKTFKSQPPQYPEQRIIDILKCFYDKGKIIGGSWMQISGGEPTLLNDLEVLIKGLVDIKIGDVCVFTNSYIYSDVIEAYLKNNSIFISTSVDTGIPSTYKKIKGKDIQTVFDTLVRYRKTNTTQLQIQYIITDDNRSEDDLFSFVLLVLALRPNIVHIIPEFPLREKIPHESAVFGAGLLYMLRKYGVTNIILKADSLKVDSRFIEFSTAMHDEYDRICAENPLTDEYNIFTKIESVVNNASAGTGGYVNNLKAQINDFANNEKKSDTKIALWGYGTYGQMLCSDITVKQNISVIIDGDERKQGSKPFNNCDVTVEAPEYLIKNHVDLIIVSTSNYRVEILDYIKNNISYEVKVIT